MVPTVQRKGALSQRGVVGFSPPWMRMTELGCCCWGFSGLSRTRVCEIPLVFLSVASRQFLLHNHTWALVRRPGHAAGCIFAEFIPLLSPASVLPGSCAAWPRLPAGKSGNNVFSWEPCHLSQNWDFAQEEEWESRRRIWPQALAGPSSKCSAGSSNWLQSVTVLLCGCRWLYYRRWRLELVRNLSHS